jgi:RNA polymerase sigma factor (sigma-70 family)
MYYVCLRYIRDESDAADVLQESFIQAYHKIEMVKEPSSFEGWLRRMVVNKCLEFLRTKSSERKFLEERAHVLDEIEDVVIDQADTEELRNTLFKAIQELPEGYRTIINLAIIEGCKHGEIAEMLKITESTSRSQLVRARAQLKKILLRVGNNRIKEYYYD